MAGEFFKNKGEEIIMKIYTFKCPKCGEFDVELNIGDNPIIYCEKCDNEVKRVYKANVNLSFKDSYNSSRKGK